jgi:hypothetical protein
MKLPEWVREVDWLAVAVGAVLGLGCALAVFFSLFMR